MRQGLNSHFRLFPEGGVAFPTSFVHPPQKNQTFMGITEAWPPRGRDAKGKKQRS